MLMVRFPKLYRGIFRNNNKRENNMLQWKTIIEEIMQEGYSQTRIARDISVSKEAVSKLMRGITHEPRYGTGSKLLALHMKTRPDRNANESQSAKAG